MLLFNIYKWCHWIEYGRDHMVECTMGCLKMGVQQKYASKQPDNQILAQVQNFWNHFENLYLLYLSA